MRKGIRKCLISELCGQRWELKFRAAVSAISGRAVEVN